MSVAAGAGEWHSPMILHLARRLEAISGGGTLAVLDLGCGDGTAIDRLLDLGHVISGCDLPERRPALLERLGPRLGDSFEGRIRVVTDERKIPFDDRSFDVVYANQVIEHVRDLGSMFAECARVLRPGGTLLVTFPPLTAPVETHLGIPFAHWLPAGALRRAYLRILYGSGLRPPLEGCSAGETAALQDRYLAEQTSYRTVGKTLDLAAGSFQGAADETKALVIARLDMMEHMGRRTPLPRRLLLGNAFPWLVSRFVVAAFSFRTEGRVSP